MSNNREHLILQWFVLVLIGTSISFSTLHSHHDIEWKHYTHHADNGPCVTENTTLCPICGYLFNAQTVAFQPEPTPVSFAGFITVFSDVITSKPYTDYPTGRSPPALI